MVPSHIPLLAGIKLSHVCCRVWWSLWASRDLSVSTACDSILAVYLSWPSCGGKNPLKWLNTRWGPSALTATPQAAVQLFIQGDDYAIVSVNPCVSSARFTREAHFTITHWSKQPALSCWLESNTVEIHNTVQIHNTVLSTPESIRRASDYFFQCYLNQKLYVS